MNRKIFAVCILLIISVLIFIACSKNSHENEVTAPTGYIVSNQYGTNYVIGDLGGELSTAISEPATDIFDLSTTS